MSGFADSTRYFRCGVGHMRRSEMIRKISKSIPRHVNRASKLQGPSGPSLTPRAVLSLFSLVVVCLAWSSKSQLAVADSEESSVRSVVVQHQGRVPYAETRRVPLNEKVLSVAGRVFTRNEFELAKQSQGAHALEPQGERQSGADGVIVELREPAVLSVYADIRESRHGAGVRTLSVDESQVLEQQRSRTTQEQDFVLNRFAGIIAGASAGPSRATSSLAAPIMRLQNAINALVLRGVSLADVQGLVQSDPALAARVKRVVPNRPVYASLTTSVEQIHAPAVWLRPSSQGIALTGVGTRIGIVDTGVDYTHPDLGGCYGPQCKVAGGYDFINNDNDPMDDHGHGTHCAATAAGDGSYVDSNGVQKPLKGVAPGATIYSYKVLSKSGSGSSSGVIKALEYCADPNQDKDFSDHLDVCSLSLGGFGDPDDPLSLAADAASRAGVVVVAAAGNSGPNASTIDSPGTSRLAITVAAGCKPGDTTGVCGAGPVATFSSRGPIPNYPEVSKPDVTAPGVNICAARHSTFAEGYECLDGTRVAISGTSMATPHVAGVAALLKQAHPEMSPQNIKDAIISTAIDLGQSRESQGGGLVHAYKALEELGFPNPIARIDGAPVNFDVEPTRTIVEVSRSVTLTSRTDEPIDFVASLQTEQAGVQLSITPEQVTLSAGAAVTFTLRAVLDLNKVPSGLRWRGRLKFASAQGDLESAVYGVVRDRLNIDFTSIDLGIKNGNDISWKDGKTLRLRNLLTDASATYNVSVSCCGTEGKLTSPGFQASSGSSSIEIPPGGFIDVPLTVEATGTKVENGLFSGLLTFTSAQQSSSVPIKFFKGWAFRYSYQTEDDRPDLIVLHTKQELLYYLPGEKERENSFLVKQPGPWQADALFDRGGFGSEPEIIFRVDQTASQTVHTIPVRRSEAQQLVMAKPRHPGGGMLRNGLSLFAVNNHNGTPYLMWFSQTGGGDSGFRAWINTFAPGIKVEASSYDVNGSTITTWQNQALGDSRAEDIVLTDSPFTTRYLSAPSNHTPGDSTSVSSYACAIGECWALSGMPAVIPAGEVGILHSSANPAVSPTDPLFADAPKTFLEALSTSRYDVDRYDSHRIFGGRWHISAAGAYTKIFFSGLEPFRENRYSSEQTSPVSYESGVGLGAGPEACVGTWFNYPEKPSYFGSRYGVWAPAYISSGGASDFFSRDEGRRISYVVYRNGIEQMAGNNSNGIPIYNGYFRPGNYRTVLKRSGYIDGMTVATESENTFTVVSLDQHLSSPRDQNPPTLRHLALVAKGIVQNVIDPTESHTLYFGIDPGRGFLRPATTDGDYQYDLMEDGFRSVVVEQSINGVDWVALSPEATSEGEFKVALPVSGVGSISKYRIRATDLAGNTFKHSFEIPTGRSLIIPTPTPSPTPDWNNSPNPTPTPRGTPTGRPTITPTPDWGSDDLPATLPKPRASLKNGKWSVSIPRIAAMSMEAERASALSQLFAAGLSSDEVARYSDITKVSGECLLSVRQGKKQRRLPARLSYLRGRRVALSAGSQVRSLRIFYSCRFYSAKPYSLLLGPVRRSAEITAGRGSRARSKRSR